MRPARPDDAGFIVDLIRGLAEYERLSEQVEASEDLLREHLFGARRVAEALIGELDGEPVAYALFFHSYSTFLTRPGIYLEDLFVRPNHRGRGVGRALLSEVARLAVERGCGRLEWAVLDWNESAIGFYRGLGASPVDGWTTYRLAGRGLAELARSVPSSKG